MVLEQWSQEKSGFAIESNWVPLLSTAQVPTATHHSGQPLKSFHLQGQQRKAENIPSQVSFLSELQRIGQDWTNRPLLMCSSVLLEAMHCLFTSNFLFESQNCTPPQSVRDRGLHGLYRMFLCKNVNSGQELCLLGTS